MIYELSQKYDLRVPRYTSYPTSPHFRDVESDAPYREWLAALDGTQRPSLYVHIPFCDSMCWFCGCYTKVVKRHEPVAEYLESTLGEIALVAGVVPTRLSARHLHFGGGSPTMLAPEEFARTIGTVSKHFDIGADAEIAVELDPRTATREYVQGLARAGVNRASIGVQDFDHDVQKHINRLQPFEMTRQVVDWLRGAGIERVNMDLMYGMPHQTVAGVTDMVDKAVSMRPARMALFGYAHVPWMKSHQKMMDEENMPDTAERWAQFEAAAERLIGHGYVAVGLDHYSLPDDELTSALREGRLHRNFQGYTTDEAQIMIGFGASAIGQLDQGYVQNKLPLNTYGADVAQGRLPVAKLLPFQGEDVLRGAIIERLMCDLEVDLDRVCSAHGARAADFEPELLRLSAYEADGLLTVAGHTVQMTVAGRPLVRLAASVFDQYLSEGQKRHSKAV